MHRLKANMNTTATKGTRQNMIMYTTTFMQPPVRASQTAMLTGAIKRQSIPCKRPHRETGFTLIELMVVVIIIAVLAMIAYPAYQQQARASRRAEAKSALQQLATRLEQYYANNKQFTNTVSNLGYTAVTGTTDTIASQNNYYHVKVTTPTTTSYTLTATATPLGGQNKDTNCYNLIYNNLDQRTSSDASNTATTGCW
jgi:type IV pilus assembly protein PilE